MHRRRLALVLSRWSQRASISRARTLGPRACKTRFAFRCCWTALTFHRGRSTGNAPSDTPHLHFTIFRLRPEKRWWEGVAVNPYPLWASPASPAAR